MPARIHGKSGSPEYNAWAKMIARCTDEKRPDYPRYGGRGISVCVQWMGSGGFAAFIGHIGPRPSAKHQIDRIENDRGYEPGNVRWATPTQQNNNKRNNHRVVYRGATMTIAEAARAGGAGVRRETARCRILNGWSIEMAVETPPIFRRDPTTQRVLVATPRAE